MGLGRVVRVEVEVPRGGRLKFRPDGRLQYASPWACPFNYGCVPDAPLADDGDPQDAVLLGPRTAPGALVEGRVVGVVAVQDDGRRDDKWVVAPMGLAPSDGDRERVQRFFWRFQVGKRLLAAVRGTGPAEVLSITWA